MIDLEKIRIFYHVMKDGSLLSASKALDKGISTLSKHLSDLEKGLNQKLYMRKHQKLELTEEGKELFSIAQSTIPALEEAAMNIRGSKKKGSDLTVVTTTGIISVWLMRRIKAFLEAHPTVSIKVITTNEEVDFKHSKADLGLLPKMYLSEGISQKKMLTLHSKLFASKEYLKKYGVPKNIEDLKKHKLISYYSDAKVSRGNVDWHLTKGIEEKSLPRESWLTVNSALCQFEAACQGLGILAISEEFDYIKDSNLVNILPEEMVSIDTYIVTRSAQIPTALAKNFIDCLNK